MGVFRILRDVYCTAGMGVRPKSDGYGYEVRGIGTFYLFPGVINEGSLSQTLSSIVIVNVF